MTLPADIKPGTWGVTHGSGFLGSAIRDAELRMGAGHEASWAGHAVVYIGNHNFGTAAKPDIHPAIVEAEWPKVIISREDRHHDTIYAVHQPLTGKQRALGLAAANGMVGEGYDLKAYAWYIARALQVRLTHNLAPLFTDAHLTICSGLVTREQEAMGVDVSKLMTAAIDQPDFVSPADLLRWGLDNRWMSTPPGDW